MIPIHFYYGTEDKFVPHLFSETLQEIIPLATLKSFLGEGHFSMINMGNEVLRGMRSKLEKPKDLVE